MSGEFLNLSPEVSSEEGAHYHVIPVPLELSVSYGAGTAKGPQAILTASAQVEFFDEEVSLEACKLKGIYTHPSVDCASRSAQAVTKTIRELCGILIANDKLPIVLGGEHTVSLGAVEAAFAQHPSLHVVHVDAHSDLREEYEGNPLSHASVIKRIIDLGIPVHSTGIRAQCREEADLIKEQGIHIQYDFERRRDPYWVESLLEQVPQGAPIYFTIDVDGLDPAIMPSTGTPVPGGLNWDDILRLSRAVVERGKLIGFDVTELAPQPTNHAPDFLVAQLIYKIISYHCAA